MRYDVYVKGLGGPAAEFCGIFEISFQVEAISYGNAVDKAVIEANSVFDQKAGQYTNAAGNRYYVCTVTVQEAMQIRRAL